MNMTFTIKGENFTFEWELDSKFIFNLELYY
jgi:hypothetical protein